MPCFRPLVQSGVVRPDGAFALAGGAHWFTHAEVLERGRPGTVVAADRIPAPELQRLISARPALAGLDLSTPHLMGIVNVTPDSFSDGGRHFDPSVAVSAALAMVKAGASLIDIGGESTRPGAVLVPPEQEIARIVPVISALRSQSDVCISIDTRKAVVAQAAIDAGASLVNDVSGLTFDPDLAPLCRQAEVPVCVMHAQGDPTTMQKNPSYDNVLLDVFDFLERQIAGLETAGVPRSRIVVDPGIGFGKTIDHNLALLRNISIFHGLGCAILLGVSRKGFIGKLGQQPDANARAPGSIAVGLAALAQGVQILRVHDVSETAQALRLWRAVT